MYGIRNSRRTLIFFSFNFFDRIQIYTTKNENLLLHQSIRTFSWTYFFYSYKKRKQFYAKVACQQSYFSIVRYLMKQDWLYLNLWHGDHLKHFSSPSPVLNGFFLGPLNQPGAPSLHVIRRSIAKEKWKHVNQIY